MVNTSVVLPIACLSGIVVAMLIFIWWFFPKWYKKGLAADRRDMDEFIRERREYEAAARATAASSTTDAEPASGDQRDGTHDTEAQRNLPRTVQMTAQTYRPPPVATF